MPQSSLILSLLTDILYCYLKKLFMHLICILIRKLMFHTVTAKWPGYFRIPSVETAEPPLLYAVLLLFSMKQKRSRPWCLDSGESYLAQRWIALIGALPCVLSQLCWWQWHEEAFLNVEVTISEVVQKTELKNLSRLSLYSVWYQ